MKREELLIAALTAGEVTHFYSALEPSPFTIEAFARTPEGIATIERNLWYAGAGALGFGVVIGQLIGSKAPIVAAVVAAALMTVVYRNALVRAVGMVGA